MAIVTIVAGSIAKQVLDKSAVQRDVSNSK